MAGPDDPDMMGEDPNEPQSSSVGEDGEGMPEPNVFPRANMPGTEHYDHAIDSAGSTPFKHEGGGVKGYGKHHPQHPQHPGYRHRRGHHED